MSESGYQDQLTLIKQALISCDNDSDRENLLSLEKDLLELISLENQNKEDEESELNNDLKELYKNLINEKCRAPFATKGQTSYHNAFIADVLSIESEGDVEVKVFFLNPTHDKMRACDFYFSDRCTFQEKCKYSHGEIVKYSDVKLYEMPDYKLLKKRCHVLVKTENSLWKPGSVLYCSHDSKTCQIKLHNSTKTVEVPFAEILPPINEKKTESSSDLSTDDSDSEDDLDEFPSKNVLQIDDTFGEWEKFTTGFGSKMLEKMGYQSGTGLGKRSDGIIQPVSARMYVQGKSLDYNMNLNEKKSQGTVEEKLKRESLAHQKRSEKNYANKGTEVFSFLNNTVLSSPNASSSKPSTSPATKTTDMVKKQSKEQLNLNSFKIEEDMKKLSQCLQRLNESLKRNQPNTPAFKNVQRQIDENEKQMQRLKKLLQDLDFEKNSRKDRSKLMIF